MHGEENRAGVLLEKGHSLEVPNGHATASLCTICALQAPICRDAAVCMPLGTSELEKHHVNVKTRGRNSALRLVSLLRDARPSEVGSM